jgi:hypothetical protein
MRSTKDKADEEDARNGRKKHLGRQYNGVGMVTLSMAPISGQKQL